MAPDYTIVGGGVVGLSLAYGISRLGKRVVILDEGDVAARASRGNFALVWLQTKGFGMPDYSRWSRHSIRLWPGFAAELKAETGVDVALEQRGGFMLYLDDNALATRFDAVKSLAAKLGADSYPVEFMGHNAVRQMLPAIGRDVVGGTYCPLDGHVNALKLFSSLHKAAQRHGAEYHPNTPVAAIECNDRSFRLIMPDGRRMESERVILAAGLGNAALAPMLGLKAPLRPERGQILVTERLEKFLDYPTGTVRQTDEGGVMIGASKEDAGLDTATRSSVSSNLAAEAVRMFPILERARIVRTWSALRVLSPDEYPIYQESETAPGAFLVTCHSGVTLAAAHALDLAPTIVAEGLPPRFDVFHPNRFADVPKAQ